MIENKPLTPLEVAEILKISKSTVYELIKRKEINSYRVGKKVRIDMQDIEDYKNRTKNIKTTSNQSISTNSSLSIKQNYEETSYDEKNFVISGQDSLLDVLCRYLDNHPRGVRALRSYEGSYNGLYELYRGKVQVASAHIWDSKTGQYNVPYVERMLPGTPAIIIHLATRVQGFYVAKGNPKGIKGWEDLKRHDITIVNREKGSGTRILLDEQLRLLNILGKSIKGYSRECLSHLAAASIIARGGADLAIGNQKASLQVQEIDFIPIQNEQYDLVIKKEDLDLPPVDAIIEILDSEEFQMEILGIGGYDITNIGKIVAET